MVERKNWVALGLPLLLLSLASLSSDAPTATPALAEQLTTADKNPVPVAIIIDDIGYSRVQGLLAVSLPAPVTLAVLPHSPHAARLAEAGHAAGKEIMLHVPMSNLRGKPLDEGALTSDMDRLAFVATLTDGLQSVPHVKGLNNHMGSLLTQDVKAMQWLMTELKARQLYFIDSRTSAASRAGETARRYGLVSGERDYFLDNDQDEAAIRAQLQRFLSSAKRRGGGIAIGHPYPSTLKVLAEALPHLRPQGLQLVPVSALLNERGTALRSPNLTNFHAIDERAPSVERLRPRHH